MNNSERGPKDRLTENKIEVQSIAYKPRYYELSIPKEKVEQFYRAGILLRIENPDSCAPPEAIENFQFGVYDQLQHHVGIEASNLPAEDIRNYFTDLGLVSESPLVVCDDNAQTKRLICDFFREDPSLLDRQFDGIFLPDFNVAITFTGDRTQGESHISTITHEIAHSTGGLEYGFCYGEDDALYFCTTRQGFCELDPMGNYRGHFIEEGRAELLASHYSFSTQSIQHPINPRNMRIPSKYLDEKEGYSASAFAAIGLELLILRNPALFDLVVDGSKSEEGRAQFIEEVEKIERGLYAHMLQVPNSTNDFAELTRHILSAHFHKNRNAPLVADKACRERFRERLEGRNFN